MSAKLRRMISIMGGTELGLVGRVEGKLLSYPKVDSLVIGNLGGGIRGNT